MGIPDHLTCLLSNLCAGHEATAPDMAQQTGFKLGKEYVKVVYCPLLFNLCAKYIMWNAREDEAQAKSKIARRNTSYLRYADNTTLMGESRGIEEPLDEGERGE